MKHLFYAFYVSFYAAAMFLAGLFFGQFMERRWAAREREEADEKARAAVDGRQSLPESLGDAPVALSNRSTVQSQ